MIHIKLHFGDQGDPSRILVIVTKMIHIKFNNFFELYGEQECIGYSE